MQAPHSPEWKIGAALAGLVVVGLIVAIFAIGTQKSLSHSTGSAAVKNTSGDRAAQSDLRNALTAEKTIYTDNQQYSSSRATLSAVESSLDWGGKLTVIVGDAVSSGDAGTVCLSEASASGTTFSIADVSAGPSAGTYFGKQACPAVATPDAMAALGSSWSSSSDSSGSAVIGS